MLTICLLKHLGFRSGQEQRLLDVVFVLGSSNRQFFNMYKKLAMRTLNSPQAADTKYGVVTYDSTSVVVRGLKDFVSKDDLANRLGKLPWVGNGTDLEGGLRKANEVFKKEARLKARRILVVYGDGRFATNVEDLKKVRQTMDEEGVKVITVTFGSRDDDMLKIVTTTDQGPIEGSPKELDKTSKDANEETLKGV